MEAVIFKDIFAPERHPSVVITNRLPDYIPLVFRADVATSKKNEYKKKNNEDKKKRAFLKVEVKVMLTVKVKN